MEHHDSLPVGKATFTPYEHHKAAYARFVTDIPAEQKSFVLDDRSPHLLAR